LLEAQAEQDKQDKGDKGDEAIAEHDEVFLAVAVSPHTAVERDDQVRNHIGQSGVHKPDTAGGLNGYIPDDGVPHY